MPTIRLPRKLKPILTMPRRFTVLVGGRGSRKSWTIADVLIMLMQTENADVLCLREFQDSIDDSVHKLFKKRLKAHGIDAEVTDKKITFPAGNGTRYKGAHRNPDSIQSAEGFKYSWFEEAHRISGDSLKKLLPTIRAPGSRLFFSANPQSSEDPFSQRFIVPYQEALDRHGFYVDDLHLIIKVNWRDNPNFPKELDDQRKWDLANLPRALYDHIWEGEFNDSVENSLIKTEWFDACIDAHIKLKAPQMTLGAKVVTHDPSDVGEDAKGLAYRSGVVFLDVCELEAPNANDGIDEACGYANRVSADAFGWDCDGLGAPLRNQVAANFQGKNINAFMFKGSEAPHNPDAVFAGSDNYGFAQAKKNKEVFKNKRAQNYTELAERCRRTYEAVKLGKYHDPDSLISFSSKINNLQKLRSELCRVPRKPSGAGHIWLYTKQEMRSGILLPGGQRITIPSPNMGDSVMMSFDKAATKAPQAAPIIPRPSRPMGMNRR